MPGLWERLRSRQQGAKLPELADAQRLIFELEDELTTPCAHLWLALERLWADDRSRARAHALTSGLSYFEGTGMLSNFDERAFFGLETGEQGEAYVLDGVAAAHPDFKRKLGPQAEAWREGSLRERVAQVYAGTRPQPPSALDWNEYPVLSRLARNKTILPRYSAARERFSLR